MADYRFLTFPSLHAKMKDYITISLLAKGKSIASAGETSATKVAKVEELSLHLKQGQAAA